MSYSVRDLGYARKAKKYGMQNSLRVVLEARRAGIPVSLGFAMVEQETGRALNIFGHDPTSSIPNSWKGTGVTLAKYHYYKVRRGRYGMQGVGPLQLTWWQTQDTADRLGGCYKTAYNLRVGFSTLAALIRQHGYARGIERYNGSGPAAVAYSKSVRARADKWHRRLT